MFELLISTPDLLTQIGLSAAALSAMAFLPYIRDTLARRTQPHLASWLIWAVLSAIAFASQLVEGAQASLWFAGVQTGGTALVFLLSLGRGVGEVLSRLDERILWLATLGLVVWYFTDEAHYALAMTITLGLLGGTLTVFKAARDPTSETLSFWVIGLISASGAMVSVGSWDSVLIAYPAYLVALRSAVVAATLIGRARRAFSFR